MSKVVWLGADALHWPEGGGYLWGFLNWALGLRAVGCEVVWLESVQPSEDVEEVRSLVAALKARLEPYGLAESVALCPREPGQLPAESMEGCIGLEAADEADLLLNMSYDACKEALGCFRRTALLDHDPGLTQTWMTEGVQLVPHHDVYFTIGETVGRPGAKFPDGGLQWEYTRPCIALDWWPVVQAPEGGPFTTVSGWIAHGDWITYGSESYSNSKRSGFMPFLDLPKHAAAPLELALCLEADEELHLVPYEEQELAALEKEGWRVVHSYAVASTPWDYQRYVQSSRGEFSCAKPAYVRLQTVWISERTLCYLASGKPAVVQHTGPSSFLPDDAGLFRFRDARQAAEQLAVVTADYETQSDLARKLVEEHFDARHVMSRLLERALP